MADKPLSNLTVIDFSRIRAGPWCTQILAELGAEVIKIERPGVGDSWRDGTPEQNGMSANFISINRNKKSVTINLKDEEGIRLTEELISDADVVIENFSPGVMERLGLDYERISEEINPEIIYASITGYGEEGPFGERKGVDLVMQAEGGLMSVTGTEEGDPIKVGQAIGDVGTGLYCLINVLTALNYRERTGKGQKIKTDIFGTIISFMESYLTMYGITGEDPKPLGTRHQTAVPYELFETKDGHMVLSTAGGGWETFVTEIVGDEELLKYDSNTKRRENYEEIMEVIRPVIAEKTTEEWRDILDEYGFPNGPLNHVSDVVDHPQAQHQGYVRRENFENVGDVIVHGHPLHFSETDATANEGPPTLGEHTSEVLQDHLNLSDDEITGLKESDTIAGE